MVMGGTAALNVDARTLDEPADLGVCDIVEFLAHCSMATQARNAGLGLDER
jgi:hypothetical protein